MDSLWTLWTPWTNCSATCGQSSKQRTRSCVDGRYGGVKCDRQFEKETKNCQTKVRYSEFVNVICSTVESRFKKDFGNDQDRDSFLFETQEKP